MLKVICSHCGETVDKKDAMEIQLKVRYFLSFNWDLPLGAGKEHNEVHLCPKCREKLGNWLTKAIPDDFNWDERR
jgi:hypothetical protein